MRFAFFLSTHGGNPLQVGLERGLNALGHSVRYFHNGLHKDFDVLVMWNQAAHRIDYAYPDFPPYDVPVAFVDCAEYGWTRRQVGVVRKYANAFAPGSMTHDTKSVHEQLRLRSFLDGRSFPYFLREFHKAVDFPANYHPIDYNLYHLSHCWDRPSKADYLGRLDSVFLSWGASHPWRWPVTRALRAAAPRAEILVLEENGTPRMEQSTYFNRMVRARCSVNFDGYGSSSFRMTEVLVRTLLLMGPLSIRVRAPLTDGVNCVMYDLEAKGEECLGTNIGEKFAEVMADPERSFEIYKAGYEHCMAHYTEEATARYFLETLERHDWSVPTKTDLYGG